MSPVFKELYSKALEEWGGLVYRHEALDVQNRLASHYHGTHDEILMRHLHWAIFCAMPKPHDKYLQKIYTKDLNTVMIKKKFEEDIKSAIKQCEVEEKSELSFQKIKLVQDYFLCAENKHNFYPNIWLDIEGNKIKLDFEILFKKALEDWEKFVDIEEPITNKTLINNVSLYDIEDKISSQYNCKNGYIIMNNLHASIYSNIPVGAPESLSTLDKQKTKENFEIELKYHMKKAKYWSKSDKKLARKYFVVNYGEDFNKHPDYKALDFDKVINFPNTPDKNPDEFRSV